LTSGPARENYIVRDMKQIPALGHYSGRILSGNFSDRLKARVLEAICHFHALEQFACAPIPYISAWREDDPAIWYEFAGRGLRDLLDCYGADLAEHLQKAIIGRCIYSDQRARKRVGKKILDHRQLSRRRDQLRNEGRNSGQVEAIYKIAAPTGNLHWLKDQATVELFVDDRICLSLGMLIDVTKEMQAEEELARVEKELRRHRHHLEVLVRDRTRELRAAQLEVVQRLARAAECRDQKTGDHITKMSRYCAMLGVAAGMRKNASDLLFHAAPMHDVGKIGITDSILLKPGPLDADEFELMKGHCVIGAKLLAGHNSDLMRTARSIALNHHEKWDGSGYPRGLSGKGIPLSGRVSAICDVFDALTSERPYKRAWPLDDAVLELQKERGRHFDPQLVDSFVENIHEIKAIHDDQAT